MSEVHSDNRAIYAGIQRVSDVHATNAPMQEAGHVKHPSLLSLGSPVDAITLLRCSPMRGRRKGFSIARFAASAADSVIVITKSVPANPSSTSTSGFPFQPANTFSSIAIEPLAGVTTAGDLGVHRQRAEERHEQEDDGRKWGHGARRDQRDARLVAERGEVVNARQPDHVPPRMRLGDRGASGVFRDRLAAREPLADA
jgi:hypothetical protein